MVLCGLDCFDAPSLLTAGAVAHEFSASLDPALVGECRRIEVYRLERIALDATLASGDAVLCRVPGWQFDLAALEDLHCQCDDLRRDHEAQQVKNARLQEALLMLNSSLELAEATDATRMRGVRRGGQPRGGGLRPGQAGPGGTDEAQSDGTTGVREVQHLKQQLAMSEKQQQETRLTVMALRSEFMHLVNMMSDTGGPHLQSLDLPPPLLPIDSGRGSRPCSAPERRPGQSQRQALGRAPPAQDRAPAPPGSGVRRHAGPSRVR